MYSCSSLFHMYPSLPQHALIRSWSTTRIRSNPSRHPAKLGSAIAKTCFPGLFPHFTRLIRTMPLGLFTLVSRVNFVGAMRNEFSQSGVSIFFYLICERSTAGYVTGDLVTRRASFVLTARFRSWVWAARDEHVRLEARTTPHAAPDANASRPHLPVRNECRRPCASLAPSNHSIDRARAPSDVHTGRTSRSGKS